MSDELLADLATRAKGVMKSHGRCQSALISGAGRVCAMGAVNHVFFARDYPNDPYFKNFDLGTGRPFKYTPAYYVVSVANEFVRALAKCVPSEFRDAYPPHDSSVRELAYSAISTIEYFNDQVSNDDTVFAMFDRMIEKYSLTAITQSQHELAAGPGE